MNLLIVNCCKCNFPLSKNEVIKTDEFKSFGSEIKNYCSSCFIENVKTGFGEQEKCGSCGSTLVLEFDDEETISLAQDDFTVHFVCEKIKESPELMDEDEHDTLILYTIAPDPEEPDFG